MKCLAKGQRSQGRIQRSKYFPHMSDLVLIKTFFLNNLNLCFGPKCYSPWLKVLFFIYIFSNLKKSLFAFFFSFFFFGGGGGVQSFIFLNNKYFKIFKLLTFFQTNIHSFIFVHVFCAKVFCVRRYNASFFF